MLTPRIKYESFHIKKKNLKVRKNLTFILKEKNQIFESLSKNYKNSFTPIVLKKFKSALNYRLIGIGGSSLGTQAIYNFLKHKIKKNFSFVDNLQVKKKIETKKNLQT